jgi:LysR family glycine cleavage system transcriptional activator
VVHEDRRPNHVVIATTESFALTWLLPRLVRFHAEHPTYVVSLRTDHRLSNIPRDADMAIRMGGTVDAAGATVVPLMDDIMMPVISAQMAGQVGAPVRPESVLQFPHLHDRDAQASWRRWSAAVGLDYGALREGPRLTSSALVLAAASKGLGIAVARRRLAEELIASGQLVELASLGVPMGTAYWLVRRDSPRSAEQFVIDWLQREARAAPTASRPGQA